MENFTDKSVAAILIRTEYQLCERCAYRVMDFKHSYRSVRGRHQRQNGVHSVRYLPQSGNGLRPCGNRL